MSLVVDASVALSFFFEDERTPAGDAVLAAIVSDHAFVPPVWRLEVANALQMAIRRRRVDVGFRDRALRNLDALPIRVDEDCHEREWTTAVELADMHNLTIYDATYLELAHRRRMPLASLDKQLRSAGRALDVVLLGA